MGGGLQASFRPVTLRRPLSRAVPFRGIVRCPAVNEPYECCIGTYPGLLDTPVPPLPVVLRASCRARDRKPSRRGPHGVMSGPAASRAPRPSAALDRGLRARRHPRRAGRPRGARRPRQESPAARADCGLTRRRGRRAAVYAIARTPRRPRGVPAGTSPTREGWRLWPPWPRGSHRKTAGSRLCESPCRRPRGPRCR